MDNSKSIYDKIEEKNYANIVAKLKDGKTLTASDKVALENYQRKQEGTRPKKSDAELAKEFGIDRRTITRWKKTQAPFNRSDKDMYQWLVANNAKGAKRWIDEYRKLNPDEFPKKKNNKAKQKENEIKTADELCDDYFEELQHARSIGDDVREKISLENYLKINKQLRDQEAHNKKLGLDSGELLSRSEVERIMRAMFWAGNACCEKFAKQIAQKLSHKEPAQIYDILAPLLTSLTIFEALKKVAKPPGEVNLPDWFVECASTEEKQYIEHE